MKVVEFKDWDGMRQWIKFPYAPDATFLITCQNCKTVFYDVPANEYSDRAGCKCQKCGFWIDDVIIPDVRLNIFHRIYPMTFWRN